MEQQNLNFITGKPPSITTLHDLVDAIKLAFAEDTVDVDYVKYLLSCYKSKNEDWKQFAHFDTHRYTRNLVDTGNDKYNLMALCWSEGQGSSIHSHSGSHCFVKMLEGQLRETRFNWPDPSKQDAPMRSVGVATIARDDVTYINDDQAVHRMENPSHSDPAVSLHLYIPPYQVTNNFDERTSRKTVVRMKFWSEYGRTIEFDMAPESKSPSFVISEYGAETNAEANN